MRMINWFWCEKCNDWKSQFQTNMDEPLPRKWRRMCRKCGHELEIKSSKTQQKKPVLEPYF